MRMSGHHRFIFQLRDPTDIWKMHYKSTMKIILELYFRTSTRRVSQLHKTAFSAYATCQETKLIILNNPMTIEKYNVIFLNIILTRPYLIRIQRDRSLFKK